ncbi:MAG: hypothetical protein E7310_01760 [Clostridiales bacterium]|nr:hypothetical protein [Clostridiales bacterium]
MAVLEVTIKEGKFVQTNNIKVEEFSDNYVRGNGWEAFITPNGRIKCQAIQKDENDIEHKIYYVINTRGSSWLRYKKGINPPILLKRGYVVAKGESIKNGTIGLSGGSIQKRYVYFRNEALQNFLMEYGISKINRLNPNRIYQGYLIYNDNEKYYSTIITDGEEEIISNTPNEKERLTKSLATSKALFVGSEKTSVKNATWVLQIIQKKLGEECQIYRILYSLESFKDLNIPSEYKVK